MKTVHPAIDFDAHYRVEGYRGIAWYLRGYAKRSVPIIGFTLDDEGNEVEFDTDEYEEVEDFDKVVAVMVGDDRKFTFGVDEISPVDEGDFCHSCGQIGCQHDGRERGK